VCRKDEIFFQWKTMFLSRFLCDFVNFKIWSVGPVFRCAHRNRMYVYAYIHKDKCIYMYMSVCVYTMFLKRYLTNKGHGCNVSCGAAFCQKPCRAIVRGVRFRCLLTMTPRQTQSQQPKWGMHVPVWWRARRGQNVTGSTAAPSTTRHACIQGKGNRCRCSVTPFVIGQRKGS
jgi:hypothetical protein